MRIYTRTGDGGTTGLQGGARVPKHDPRIRAYGAVDELNSALGAAAAQGLGGGLAAVAARVQGELFTVGADLSNPDASDGRNRVAAGMVEALERDIDALEARAAPLENFVLPGGAPAAAALHLARAVARRAEREAAELGRSAAVGAPCMAYLNRLSDLLFAMARAANAAAGVPDAVWRAPGGDTL